MAELGNTAYFNRLVNKVTGVKVKVLNDNTWLKTVSYYDERGRVIQTIADNYAGGMDRSTIQYDFAGRILSTKLTHTGIEPISVLTQNSYDHASRLTDIHHTINGGDRVNIAHYEYNELGQLVDKKLHFNTGLAACSGTTLTVTSAACATVMATQSVTFGMGFSFVASAGNTFIATVGTSGGGGSPTSGYLQSVDYRYNIRGWLSSINNSALTDGDITNDDGNDVWGMELKYNNPALGTTAQYNGNIAEMIWNRKDHTTYATLNPIGYSYSYDPANRLINAKSATKTSSWSFDTNYDETFGYDKNGSMTSLVRYGLLSGVRKKIDDLSYVYNGNLVKKIEDAGETFSFENKVNLDTEYTWDANGNMTSSLNKGVNISYNMLNLPLVVSTITGNNLAVYVYDAAGRKIATNNYQNGVLASTTQYMNGLVFTDNAIEYLLTSEGRVTKIANNWNYEYFYKDHLGNVRMSFDKDPSTGNARTIQENAYYSFGSGMPGMSWIAGTENLLKYNGKEEQKKWNVLDYGARYYDPVCGCFHTIDPRAEDYPSQSPYAYAAGNPVRYQDFNGEGPWDVVEGFKDAIVSNFSFGLLGNSGNYAGGSQYDYNTGRSLGEGVTKGLMLLSAFKNGSSPEPELSPSGTGLVIKAPAPSVIAPNAVVSAEGESKTSETETKQQDKITEPYKRPNNATTPGQRQSVQNKPCVDCGKVDGKKVADHKTPLVKEYYQSGKIDKQKMKEVNSVQPQCTTCSAKQGAEMSKYSKEMKKQIEKQ